MAIRGWTAGGFIRTNAAPLTSYGITNNTGTQTNRTTRTAMTPKVDGQRAHPVSPLPAPDGVAQRQRFVHLPDLVDGRTPAVHRDPSYVGVRRYPISRFRCWIPHPAARFSYTRNGGTLERRVAR